MTTKVLQVDLARKGSVWTGLDGYERARVLVRYEGHVVGQTTVQVDRGMVSETDIRLEAMRDPAIRERISKVVVRRTMKWNPPVVETPSWSVIVCTRNRPHMLPLCLDSIVAATKGGGEVIVVDNAPSSDATERLVAGYPTVRYVRESVQGLNRARLKGARIASGDILIYTDDDVVAEEGWIPALLAEFAGARVGAVTGLTMPYELETDAQELFEANGGFVRGFERRVFDHTMIAPVDAGPVGAGANMAFRRDLVLSMGLFDHELDLGTPSRTGGDTFAFVRLLSEGYRIVYTPDALNWHRHRREHDEMVRTMAGYSTGGFALLTKSLVERHDVQTFRVGLRWFLKHHIRELFRTLARRPNHLPLDFVMAEIRGAIYGPFAYVGSRRKECARPVSPTVAAERVRT